MERVKGGTGRREKVLVLGGASSGKSAFALSLAEDFIPEGRRGLFVATAECLDEEMEARILRHRRERGERWETIEEPVGLPEVMRRKAERYPVLLVDCLTLWISNLIHRMPAAVGPAIEELEDAFSEVACPVIMVSNEVGLGIVPMDPVSRAFRDLAGRLHQGIARRASSVYFVVAGLPMKIGP